MTGASINRGPRVYVHGSASRPAAVLLGSAGGRARIRFALAEPRRRHDPVIDGTYVGLAPGQSRVIGQVVAVSAALAEAGEYIVGVTLLVDGRTVQVLDEGGRLYLDNVVHGHDGLPQIGTRVAVTGRHDDARAAFIADTLEELE